jgi:hypothetical protein
VPVGRVGRRMRLTPHNVIPRPGGMEDRLYLIDQNTNHILLLRL